MYIAFILNLLFFVTVFSNIENDLIVDYFSYQNIPSVIGFSCNAIKEDLSLVKELNHIGIASIISKSDYENHFNRFAHSIYRKLGIFFDLRCYETETITTIFSKAGDYNMYDDLHYWFVIASDIKNISKLIDDKAFGYSTNFVISIPLMSTKNYELYDVYNLWKERGMKLHINLIGFWNKKDQINIVNTSRFERRANLGGMIMRASFYRIIEKISSNISLENYFQDNAKITEDRISKLGYVMLTHLADLLNFKLQCKLVSKWQKGDPVGPTVQAVMKKECDITGTPALITQKRLNVLKFTYQLIPHRTCFIFRSPQPKVIRIEDIFGPLDTPVWFMTLAILILSIFVLILILKLEKLHQSTLRRFSDSILATIGALCQQGTDIRMTLTSTRFVYFFITLFSFLLYNYYSATIVSIRLNAPIFKINDSLVELAKTNLKLLSEHMEFFELYIKQKNWETEYFYNNRWKIIPKDEQFMIPEKALVLVKKGGYAYHTIPHIVYTYINQKFTEQEICELTEVHLQKPAVANFGIEYNSTIVEMLRVGISKMSEVGLRNRQVIRWQRRKPICKKDILRVSSVTFFEFASHLLILISGLCLAIIVFAVEIIRSR